MYEDMSDEDIVKEMLFDMKEHERWEFAKRFLNDEEIIEGILGIIGDDAISEVAQQEREDWAEHMEEYALANDTLYWTR